MELYYIGHMNDGSYVNMIIKNYNSEEVYSMEELEKSKQKSANHEDEEVCCCGHHHHEEHDEHEEHEHHHHHEDDDDNNEHCGCGHHHHHEDDDDNDEHCGCGHHHHHEDDDNDEHCGCGHHHHHEEHDEEHDEHCRCGHHHHHEEHDDEHDEHCGCGHHHHHEEYDDGHEEHCGCGCGHEHEHHHEHAEHHHGPAPKSTCVVYVMKNIDCANCSAKIEKKIQELPEVDDCILTFATRQLRVYSSVGTKLLPKMQEIADKIEPGTIIEVREEGKPADANSDDKHAHDLPELIAGGLLFIIGELLSHSMPQISAICFVIAYLILGREVLLTALKNMKTGHVMDENFLMSIATIGAFCVGQFGEAVGVMLFYRVGETFEHRAVEKSRSQIMEAVDLRPETVLLDENGTVREVPAGSAVVGNIVEIRPGDRIPLDGVVVEGESRIDTSPITGEPVPVSVKVGSQLTSGCVNTSGLLKMRVEKELSESMVTRILDSVENAAASKPQAERFITKFARIYTPFVVALAAATAIIPSLITGNWSHWIYTALTFLVISCPCALVLSVPLAFFSGIGAGSKKGILFKGGIALENLKAVKTVVMDKTGTITKGNFVVQTILPAGTASEQEILQIAAACETASTHPIGVSIVSAAKDQNLVIEKPAEIEEISGKGIHARLSQGEVLCGNRKLLTEFNVDCGAYDENGAVTTVYISVNGKLAGTIQIADTIKPEAKDAIRSLKSMGIRSAMLTGDGEAAAEAVAAEVGIDNVYAKLLPADKLEILQKLRAENGSAMFVGDGINDAPVLAGADVGAAMGSGADAAIEAADVVFMTSSMDAIPEAIRIARSTGAISNQNVVFALAVKALVMILGLRGIASMWLAVFADTGVAILCVLNSIRILYKK